MTKEEFARLMEYPSEWFRWDMLPNEVLQVQIDQYEPGSENASEHYRNGAFFYWLKRNPSKEVLLKLVRLSFLDPDPLMAKWLRNDHIAKAECADAEVNQLILEMQI